MKISLPLHESALQGKSKQNKHQAPATRKLLIASVEQDDALVTCMESSLVGDSMRASGQALLLPLL
jgi:hypothetical protein